MYVIGLDIGTTGTKALLVDTKDGTVLGKGYQGYSLVTQGAHVEQDANDWIKASVFAISEALRGNEHMDISALSISSQGASMAIADRDGKPLCRAITWMDTRASAEAAELEQALGNDYVYHMCGWRIYPTLDAAKILCLKHAGLDQPGCRYLSTIEIVNQYLTGHAIIDPTNAAIRQLMDIRTASWDDRMLQTLGISPEQLPEIKPTGTLVGALRKEAALATGLREGTPVFSGAHDQYCASIGAAAISSGDMLLSAGTTWVVLGLGTKPLFTPSFIAPSIHPVPGLYGAIASLSGSGVSMEWYKNKFLPDIGYRVLDTEAETRAIGDLFYYPYPLGAAYPLWNSRARAAFTGSTLEHDRFSYARAIMEGVAFGVRRTLADFSANGCDIATLKVLGGAAKSAFWTRLICDIADVPVELLREPDACALGAAVIAACGAGAYPDYISATKAMVRRAETLVPNPEQAGPFAEKYKRYERLWSEMSRYYQ
ncbi:MAG: FGGY family carbohydrate kinase [Eubacteriales bacterium]|nr:FGGY family carbohydrate kinase [Eubacteriales bacterium]